MRLTGRDNPRYNGGLCQRREGRWVIVCRDGSLMLFSRAVMAAHLGRLLTTDEIVHHLNGDVADDRIENLSLTDRTAHIAIHRTEILSARRRKITDDEVRKIRVAPGTQREIAQRHGICQAMVSHIKSRKAYAHV